MYNMFNKKALVGLAFAAAATTLVIKRESDMWVNDDGGIHNTQVGFSGEMINWGVAPPWYVLDTLKDHCDVMSCDDTWTYPTRRVDSRRESQSGTISVTVSTASYQEWAKNGLIEILKTTSSKAYSVEQVKYTINPCYSTSCQTVPSETGEMSHYTAPKRFSLRSEDSNGAIIHVITVEVSVTWTDELGNACENILGAIVDAGTGIAGAVNAWLGAGFGLAKLACLA